MSRGGFEKVEWSPCKWPNNVQCNPVNRVQYTLNMSDTALVQGDHSACSKPPVDIDLKVEFHYKVLILKRNFQINVNRRF